MLLVLTNDDGIEAKGIKALHRHLRRSHEVVVVAPDTEQSACSHGISLHRPLRLRAHSRNWYSVDGTPTDCVNLAVYAVLKKNRPDLIISGINLGPNLGTDVLYSGTVAGAIEGAILGISSIAVSLALDDGDAPDFEPAAVFITSLVDRLRGRGLPPDTCLNVNVPKGVRGPPFPVRVTRLGKRRYTKVVREGRDPRGKAYFWIGGDPEEKNPTRLCDSVAVGDGFVSVTPLKLDLTAPEHSRFIRAHLRGGRFAKRG